MKLSLLVNLTLVWLFAPITHAQEPSTPKPNILYILADDLGYGDVHALNPIRGKISTPHLDQLIADGLLFSNAHSGSSVCTPTRYGLLTGRYAWRTHLQSGVLNGDSKALISPNRLTVPAYLKTQGYFTAAIGKWHLGMTLPPPQNLEVPITDGPTTRGFDYFFGISASLDMPPFAFIENNHYTESPTAVKSWVRKGPAAPSFEAADALPTLTQKSIAFIDGRSKIKNPPPFFLYVPLTSPHTPILPSPQWQGKSALGPYGDFVMQTDDAVGQILAALDKADLRKNTLVIFTSDNGCSPAAGTARLEKLGHFPSGEFRGYKADIWDGGHRVPFIVRWPNVVTPGSSSSLAICHTDLLATCAEISGVPLPETAGEDSFSFLPILLGREPKIPRAPVIHHSINGKFAIRDRQWKLALCSGSGGWSKGPGVQSPQLYDFNTDPSETNNLATAHPEIVAELTSKLEKIINDGRSTAGPKQANDQPVKWSAN